MSIRAYARCSTNETKQDVNRQIREFYKFYAPGDIIIYKEYVSNSKPVKPELRRLFDEAQAGDTIVVTEISRLSRKTMQICEIIDIVKQKKLCLQILNSITMDCRDGKCDPLQEAFITLGGVISQFELTMVKQRVRSGMANARAKGKTIGRRQVTVDMLPDSMRKYYPLLKEKKMSVTECAKLLGITRPTVYKWMGIIEESKQNGAA